MDGIVEWKSVAAILLSDKDGSKTEIIARDNHYKIKECCSDMIRKYLQSGEVSWNKVLEALSKAGEKAIAKKIQCLL